jgi:type I restriction enzyme, S subunit
MNAAPTNGSPCGSRDWQELAVRDCLQPFEIEVGKKVLARDYKANGKFPIVDQGQSLVAGYTDNKPAVIADGLPVVVFGDHTRVFKFVDFPFVIGADGTKLLKPIADLDPKFFYFACLMLDIPSRGYNRHFKILREQSIRFPERPEQEKIAAVLWNIQKAVEIEATIVRNARDLKKSLLRRLFTHGLRGEPLKETEIGSLPKNWEVRTFASVASLERGRFLHRPRNEPRFYGGNTPFVQTGDVVRSGGRIRTYSHTLNEEGIKISRIFPAGTILITIAANIGYSGILEFDSACPDSLIGITPRELVEGEYLLYYLQTQQSRMDTLAPRGTQKNINIQFLSPWPVALPPKDEQHEIADILQNVDRKIDVHESKKRSLQDLFKTALHKLMTAQIRVNDLEIDTSEVEGGRAGG